MKRVFLNLISFVLAGFVFINCDDSTKEQSEYLEAKTEISQSGEIQYITPPRLSDSGEALKYKKERWYSFIFQIFKQRKRPLPFMKTLISNTGEPDIELCKSDASFTLPDTTMICVDITSDGKIIFDFDFSYPEDNPIFVETETVNFYESLLEYQLKFLEHNINPPMVFRIDEKTTFDIFLRLSKILRNIEMEYITVITKSSGNETDSRNNEFYALELPLASESLVPPPPREVQSLYRSNLIQISSARIERVSSVYSRILCIYLDEFGNTYYQVGLTKPPKMIDDIELSDIISPYYRNIQRLHTMIGINPQVSFCRLIDILDMIRIVEQDIRNSLIDVPLIDRPEIDFFRRMRIQETTVWDEYVLDIIRENPDSLEELEDLY